jgi:hypothetical protein
MLSRDRACFLLREQAAMCAAFGSPLYADLLGRVAGEIEGGGDSFFPLIAPHDAPSSRSGALALRLMAAVHRLVLTGEAQSLARHYPSVGGRDPDAWTAFEGVVRAQRDHLAPLVALPCQTNEVGRAAALAFGFFEIASTTGLPLRLLEVGASAGLNLRWDQYRYGGGGAFWGPAQGAVDLTGLWQEAPDVPPAVEVIERSGCDPRPVDPTSALGRLSLESSIWADQKERFTRLRGALDIASRVPARLEQESVESWLPRQLERAKPGVATVVYHSIVQEYFSDETRDAFFACLDAAGRRATRDAPLAWLRLEPVGGPTIRYAVSLTSWPGGEERIVAWSGPHGTGVLRGDSLEPRDA